MTKTIEEEEIEFQEMMEAEIEAASVKAEVERHLEKQRKDAELKAMTNALDHGVINKDPDSKVTSEELHDCIEREQILMEEKRERRERYGTTMGSEKQ